MRHRFIVIIIAAVIVLASFSLSFATGVTITDTSTSYSWQGRQIVSQLNQSFGDMMSNLSYNLAYIHRDIDGIHTDTTAINLALIYIQQYTNDLLTAFLNHALLTSNALTNLQSYTQTIGYNTDLIHTDTSLIKSNTDDMVSDLDDINTSAGSISTNTLNILSKANSIDTRLTLLNQHANNIVTNTSNSASRLLTLNNAVDGVEGSLSNIEGYVDGLEYNTSLTNTILQGQSSQFHSDLQSINNNLNYVNWHQHNSSISYSQDNVNYSDNLSVITNSPSYFRLSSDIHLSSHYIYCITLPIYFYGQNENTFSIIGLTDRTTINILDIIYTRYGTFIYFTIESGQNILNLTFEMSVLPRVVNSISYSLTYLNTTDKDFYTVLQYLEQKQYLNSINQGIQSLNTNIDFDDDDIIQAIDDLNHVSSGTNKVDVSFTVSDAADTTSLITRLRNLMNSGVSIGSFANTLGSSTLFGFFDQNTADEIQSLNTQYAEPSY